jgi:Na+/proline symporter
MIGTTTWMGIVLIAILMTSIPVCFYARGYGNNKESFLLSLRNLSPAVAGISLGMAWANSPSLFIASGQAYNVGLVGWFWFAIGNILTLAVFGWGAQKVRQTLPEGYTMAGYMKKIHGPSIHKNYLICSVIISFAVVCIGLVAISTLIAITSGISKLLASLIIVATAATLSFRAGFRATVLVEIVKFVIALIVFGFILYSLATLDTIKGFADGLGGIKGTGGDIIGTENAWKVFATFGIINFLGQMSAPWVDNNFIQRAFAYGGDKKKIYLSFILGALCFAIFPITTGIVAFYGVANSATVVVPDGQAQYVIVHIIDQLIGHGVAIAFCLVAFLSSLAIVDDQINNFSDLFKNDIIEAWKIDENKQLLYTRIGSIIFVGLAVMILNLGFVNLLYVLLLGNIIRASMGLTTAGLIFKPTWFDASRTGTVLTLGLILTGIGFTYVTVEGLKDYILPLTLISFVGTPVTAYLVSKIK